MSPREWAEIVVIIASVLVSLWSAYRAWQGERLLAEEKRRHMVLEDKAATKTEVEELRERITKVDAKNEQLMCLVEDYTIYSAYLQAELTKSGVSHMTLEQWRAWRINERASAHALAASAIDRRLAEGARK